MSYSQYGFDEEYGQIGQNKEIDTIDKNLKEGFSTGGLMFLLTVAGTIASFAISSKVAGAVASRSLPFGGNIRAILQQFPILRPIASRGLEPLKKVMIKEIPIAAIINMAVTTILVFATLWLFNTITLLIVIYKDCKRFQPKIAMKNALAGSIPSALLVLGALIVIFVFEHIFPFILVLEAMGLVSVAIVSTMLIFNLIFGAGVGQATGLSQGCAAPAPAPTPAPTPTPT